MGTSQREKPCNFETACRRKNTEISNYLQEQQVLVLLLFKKTYQKIPTHQQQCKSNQYESIEKQNEFKTNCAKHSVQNSHDI
jgi:hypothetical protein